MTSYTPKHKQSYEAHKEKSRAYMKVWIQNNKEKVNQYMKVWRQNNKEKVNQYMKEYMRTTRANPKEFKGDNYVYPKKKEIRGI